MNNMKSDETMPGSENAPAQDNRNIIQARIEHLRTRLLDSSRRNPLIQVPFRQNSSSLIRFVDELPDVLAQRLATQHAMRLAALPPIDEPLPDEQTNDFLNALEIARTTDEDYLSASEDLDPTDPDHAQKEFDIERALKDRVRAELGLPERQTEENPSLAAHARNHNISPDYTLPLPSEAHDDGRHEDADIQTLLLPDRLDRVARSLHDRGHAFERETGVNVLHTAFGILEWKEPGSSRSPARSPLLLLEVRMTRKKAPSGTEYHICGENDLGLNTTLAQTFNAQFGLDLPAYEGGSIESYFDEIAAISPKGWHWHLRREALVGVFPSSRIAMYRDLDPSEDKASVLENPIIESLLATTGGDSANYAEVYDTDDPEIEQRVPHLVMDADASQFSSLVDVANGKNIAIEGPPGSGKSQTIVNLIASAMADGKKVLFVAEKLTALDVVRNRLEAIGLGEFVLPLQAGRGSRDAVFQSLEERIKVERPPHGAAEEHHRRHQALMDRRNQMQAYLDMLGTQLGRTGMTVHEALGQAIATADHLDGLPRNIRNLRLPEPENMDPDARAILDGDAQMIVERLNNADQIAEFWREARKAPLRNNEAEDIAVDLSALIRGIEALRAEVASMPLSAILPSDPIQADKTITLDAIEGLAVNPDMDPVLIEALLDEETRQAVHSLCEMRDLVIVSRQTLEDLLSEPDGETVDAMLADAERLSRSYDGEINPGRMTADIHAMEEKLDTLKRQEDLSKALPARWAETADQDGTTLAELHLDIQMLLHTPQEVLNLRQPDDSRSIPVCAREAATTKRQLSADLKNIRKRLPNAQTHKGASLRVAADAIEEAGFLRFLSKPYKAAWSLYHQELGGNPKEDRADIATTLREYAEWADKRDSFNEDARLSAVLGTQFSGLASDPDMLDALGAFYETANRISCGDERLRYALEAGSIDVLQAFADEAHIPSITLSELRLEIKSLQDKIAAAHLDLDDAKSFCLSFDRRAFVDGDMIARAQEARHTLLETQSEIEKSAVAELLRDTPTEQARTLVLVATSLDKLPEPRAGLDLLQKGERERLHADADEFFSRIEKLSQDAEGIALEIDHPCQGQALRTLSIQMDNTQDAADRPEGLVERARLLRAISAFEERGLHDLPDWIQSDEGRGYRDALPNIVSAIYARSLTDHIESRFGRIIEKYDGKDLDRLRGEIAEIDHSLTIQSRLAIREELITRSDPPRGNGVGRVGTYTEMSLIGHELGKVRNRIGVRDLTSRAGQALIDLKPCWMMSPLAVSQYLDNNFIFDLVVIDEASQMTPENALGAIMRARQIVVVGDTKQLPPTNFFSKILDDIDEDEDTRTDSESILEMANTTFTPVRQLRWHYRSRHPNLIAISNKMIYDEQLTIFPAARDGDPALGVDLVEVEGKYRKGRNIPEAKAIVAGAIAHMRDYPNRSLGLATMNKDQTEIILSEFERERERHPYVEAFIERWAEKDDGLEEFFVKNLETIQGDERDVIMISTLYGPDADTGKVYQRFGPVNSVHGHRRLNVLFSRAKEKIVTYTSMKPTDIQHENKAYGVSMLRAWLEFSKTGQITEIQSAQAGTDSPFEDHVIAQIQAAGYEAVPQVGASGYRIDIGVRHPDWPYGFILAVECDGATYHSSRSSRDRDRLRQQVLEGLGWRFYRIWSTDWFRDPRTQIERLRSALDTALKRAIDEEAKREEQRAAAAERAQREAQEAAKRLEEEANKAQAENLPDENPQQGSLF
jgi:RecA/RadA recombinase